MFSHESLQVIKNRKAGLVSYASDGVFFALVYGSIFNLEMLMPQETLRENLSISEKLLIAFKHSQENFPERLHGDFVIVLVNMHEQSIDIFKSPFATKSLFYTCKNGVIYLSGSMPFLRKMLPYDCSISKEQVVDMLFKQHQRSDSSFYETVFQLKNAEHVKIKINVAVSKRLFWVVQDKSRQRSLDEYTEGLRYFFNQAVNDRLSPLDRVCSEISGGLDSSSVSAVLVSKFPDLLCFSEKITREDLLVIKQAPDRANAQQLDDFESLYSHVDMYRLDYKDTLNNYSDVSRFCYEWSGAPERAPCNTLRKLDFYNVAKHTGYNKIFCGSLGDGAFSFRGPHSVSLLKKFRKFYQLPKYLLRKREKRRQFLLGLLRDRPSEAPSISKRRAFKNEEALSCYREDWMNTALQYTTAASNFNNAAYDAFQIERTDPTSDQLLIEYCLTIPASAYLNNGLNRYVAREAMKGLLPDSIRLNITKGAQANHWYAPLRKELSYYKSLLSKFSKNELIRDVIDLEILRSLLLEFEFLSPAKLTDIHKLDLLHALHVCEWILLHDENLEWV